MVIGNCVLCRSMVSDGGEGGSCEQAKMGDDELVRNDEGAKGEERLRVLIACVDERNLLVVLGDSGSLCVAIMICLCVTAGVDTMFM